VGGRRGRINFEREFVKKHDIEACKNVIATLFKLLSQQL